MQQPSLLDACAAPSRSVRKSRVPVEDRARMASLKVRIYTLMRGEPGRWWTLRELSDWTNGLQTSVSMRLQEITYEQPDGYTVEKQRRENGLFVYRLAKEER